MRAEMLSKVRTAGGAANRQQQVATVPIHLALQVYVTISQFY